MTFRANFSPEKPATVYLSVRTRGKGGAIVVLLRGALVKVLDGNARDLDVGAEWEGGLLEGGLQQGPQVLLRTQRGGRLSLVLYLHQETKISRLKMFYLRPLAARASLLILLYNVFVFVNFQGEKSPLNL